MTGAIPDIQNYKKRGIALHFSILMYVFVLYFLAQNSIADEWVMTFRILPDQQMFVIALAAFSLVNTGMAIFLKPLIPRMALAESIAIFGFLAAFLYQTFKGEVQSLSLKKNGKGIAAFLNYSFLLVVPFALWALILQIFVGPWFQSQGLASPPPSA